MGKYCIICNRKIDMRKKGSTQLNKEFCIDVPNPDFHYVCSEEHRKEFRKRLGFDIQETKEYNTVIGDRFK